MRQPSGLSELLWQARCLLITQSGARHMDAALQTQMTVAALICSVAALFFSLLAAFPGLKGVLAAIRDGVLWFALFLILGGLGIVGWEHLQELQKPALT